ncbi:MAG: hydantoinase B/oxoprolinase family protein [bacterium]
MPGERFLYLNGEIIEESKARIEAEAGDVISLETPGGGGWGKPGRRRKG